MRKHLMPLLCGLILLVLLTTALAAPLITAHDPTEGYLENQFQPPAWVAHGSRDHWLGTDHLGRDVLSRVLYGGRISMLVGVASVLLAGVVGVTIGLVSGYYGGVIDRVFSVITDIQMSFPFLCLAVALVAVIGPGLRNVIIVLALNGWVLYARIVRVEVLRLRQLDFIEAGKALGATDFRLMVRSMLPNVMAPIIVVATFAFAQVVLVESSLSFLGVGVQPPTPTWGGMLSDAREYLQLAWWPVVAPGTALVLAVLAINILGDWLRDRFDPSLQV